jgi:hypothetical protein
VFLNAEGFLTNFDINTEEGKLNRNLFSMQLTITTFCLWLKFFYFLRIFENTGFLVRAIMAVIYDMRYFFVILMISLLAFGDSFKVMSNANYPEK